jgi:hypothetical protein
MAIKVGGTTVVDDSRNITNVGTVTATTFSGAGGSLTGVVTGVTGTAPISSSGGATPALSMAAATASVNGYMTSTYASKLDGIAAGATNVTNTNQLTNGAGFITSAPAPSAADGASMALISCVCSSGAATIELTGFSDTYMTYMLVASNVTQTFCSAALSLNLVWKVDGSYESGSNCYQNAALNTQNASYSGGNSAGSKGAIFNCGLGCMSFHPGAATWMIYGFRCSTSAKSMMGLNSTAAGGAPTVGHIYYYAGNNGSGRAGTVSAICIDNANACACPITGLFKLYGIK